MTTYVMRCIDKAGGFDNYILNTKDKDLDSKLALDIRQQMRDAMANKSEISQNEQATNTQC